MKKLIIVLCFISSLVNAQDSTYVKATVMAVHDLDTWKVKIGETDLYVRLWGIDGAEIFSPYVCNTQENGRETGDTVRKEMKGKEVFLKFMGLDVFKRQVVKVNYLGFDYNTQLVARGMAWVVKTKDMDKSEYKILIEYKKLALKNRIGLFVNPKAISPELFRKKNRCKK